MWSDKNEIKVNLLLTGCDSTLRPYNSVIRLLQIL